MDGLQGGEGGGGVAGRGEADERRVGDAAILVADSATLRQQTGWSRRWSALDTIVETACQWRKNHPGGYAA